MNVLSNPTVVAVLVSLAIGLIAYAVLVPRNQTPYSPNIPADNKSAILRFATSFGADLHATLPAGTEVGAGKNAARIQSLLVRSGNPWNFTVEEFRFFQIASAALGFILGWVAWFLIHMRYEVTPFWIVVPIVTIFAYRYPKSQYENLAQKRDFDFKRQLPEALDLILITLAGGGTFMNAVRKSVPNMKDGVLKREFIAVLKDYDSGRTVSEALSKLAERAPNESIRTFVQAVRESSELNTSVHEILIARAEESREDFYALVQARTAALESRMGVILGATLLPSLLIMLMAPTVTSLMKYFGS